MEDEHAVWPGLFFIFAMAVILFGLYTYRGLQSGRGLFPKKYEVTVEIEDVYQTKNADSKNGKPVTYILCANGDIYAMHADWKYIESNDLQQADNLVALKENGEIDKDDPYELTLKLNEYDVMDTSK